MKQKHRSLYCCANARVKGKEIYCKAGKTLVRVSNSGNLHSNRLARGDALEFTVCQNCLSYDEMGEPVPSSERGWVKTS